MFRIDRSVVRPASGDQAYVVLRVPETAPPPSHPQAAQPAPVLDAAPTHRQTDPDAVRQLEERVAQLKQQAEQQHQQIQQARTDAQEELALILQNAQEQARQTLQQAQEQADEVLAQARRQGYEAGRQEGLALLERQREAAQQGFERIAQTLRDSRSGMIAQLERDVLKLSLEIAGKVLGMELAANDDAYPSMVRYGLAKLQDKPQIRLRVNQQDYERFFEGEAPWLGGPAQQVSVLPDDQLSPGEVIAECGGERLDLGADTQIRMMTDTLMPMRGTGIVEDDGHDEA